MTADQHHHQPRPPAWTCAACDQPWPCPSGRQQLLADHAPGFLFMYLGCCLTAALVDLPAAPVTALRARFLEWIPRRGTRLLWPRHRAQ